MHIPQVTSEFISGPGKAEEFIFCPDSRSPLKIPQAVFTRILEQVNEGVRAVPRGGAEVGGLLVGPKNYGESLTADDVLPIVTEYRFGPGFRLSPKDLAGVEELFNSLPPSKTVVGLYRSRTRGQAGLRETDRELLRALEGVHSSFAVDFRFVVLLEPLSKFKISAATALRKDGDWPEWETVTVRAEPGGSPTMMGGSLPAQVNEPVRHAPESPVEMKPAATVRHAAGADPPRSSTRWRVFAASILVFAIAAGAFFLAAGRSKTPVPAPAVVKQNPTSPHADFSAHPEGGLWKLSWNRDAVMAMQPTRAVLSILDGGHEQRLTLTPADLSTGMAYYGAQGGDLLFSLIIERAGQVPLEEHVRVLEGTKPGSKTTPLR